MTGVEAATLSAAVSGTLKILGNKLAPLLIKEYSSIVGVKEDLQELHDLVEEINFWLETTSNISIGSRQSFIWLKKLKDISYDVDDVVDEFQLKAEKHDSNGDGGIVSRYMCTIPKSFVFQCKEANKIKAIKRRFAAIVKQRTDYLAITNSLSVDPHVQHINIRSKEVPSSSNVDEVLIVGRDKDKQKIISMLQDNDDQQKIKIVSIIGLGGSGKTTLAKLVFNNSISTENHFDLRLWVHVSQEFEVKDLVKKLFEAFSDNNPGPHALPYMTKTISDKLIGKRFLLVLDDVWTNSRDEWEEFMVYIKGAAPKSRILLTTRSREVAVIVGSTDQFHLPFLSPDVTWQLFQQSLVTPPTSWNFEFEEVGKAIVEKCGGVPLAIKVLAGALHGKDRIEEWQAMRDKTNVNVQEDRVTACLRLSYSHLPSNLKQCFTICSVFPKGHKIDKQQLIDLWIAHDMISLEDGVDCLDLEYVGQKHFNSLLQVSFLQNVEEKYGRVTCGMHDLVHDLALSILGDEISLKTNEAIGTTKSYRYFSLIKQPENLVPKNLFRKTRAVYMHGYGDHIYGMALKHAKHLRSVRVGFIDAKEANTISQVKYLKYLAMSLQNCETLPESISDIWSLQALHVTHSSSLVKLPKSIGKLKKLRTLNLSGCLYLKSLPESIGDCEMISNIDLCSIKLTVLPNSIGRLQKLSTLNLSRCGGLYYLPESIGDCPMISIIDLSDCWGLTVLPNSIGKLQKLRTLNLSWCRGLKCLPDSIGGCQMISSIDLSNCLGFTMLPKSIGKLQKLRILNLSRCGGLKCLPYSIGDCQMISSIDLSVCCGLTVLPNSIGKLQKLRTLNLSWCQGLKCLPDSIGDCQMMSSIDLSSCIKLTGLPNSISKNEILRVLRLGGTKIVRLPSSTTTLRNLECLDLQGCCELVELPEGIGNMEKLQFLNLKGCGKLGGMPIGIGQLSRLQKLGLFVVGKGEKFAGISELANVSEDDDELTIKGLSHTLDPNDAHLARLKQKTNLQRLDLDWMINDVKEMKPKLNWMKNGMKEVNTKLEQDVLDGLEAPPGIKELEIHMYSGRQYARWMQNQVDGGVQGCAPFPFLRVMKLNYFRNLKNLHGLVELPCLEDLELTRMPSLESISGGPFPSLVKLKMHDLPCLGAVWMVAERTMLDGEEGGGCCKCTPQSGQVRVRNCPKLEMMPHLPPSLQHLQLWGSEKLLQAPGQCQGSSSSPSISHLKNLQLRDVKGLESGHCWKLLQHLTALESLEISHFSGVQTEVPESLWSLTCLRSLKLDGWSNIRMLPESLGELRSLQELTIESCPRLSSLPESMGQLTSLQLLTIGFCRTLQQLPDCLGELCSLRILKITYLQGLSCLPQSMWRLTTSLQELEIAGCPGITSLPQGIKGLVSLEKLSIRNCRGLTSLP